MSNHQVHFGRKFYLDKKTLYWISTDYPRIRAHQWVWISIHGIIPKGYHIHHKNEDKADNRIENLELIERSRHLKHHMADPIRKQKSRETAAKIRPLTIAWHKSEEGKTWHKLHALKTNFGNGEFYNYKCQQCSVDYKSKIKANDRTRFCSNACKSMFRRKSKIDHVSKICPVCKVEYQSSKYSRSKTCGRTCGKKLSN